MAGPASERARQRDRSRHQHLEQVRGEVIELLSRQALEMTVVQSWQQAGQERVQQLVERQHRAAIGHRLARFHPADVAHVLESLEPQTRDHAWSLVRAECRGAVLLEISDEVRNALVRDMPPTEIVELVSPLDPKDIAALVSDLPEHTQRAVLEHLGAPDQAEVRVALAFPEGSVGAAMDRDIVAVSEQATLEVVLAGLRTRAPIGPHTTQFFVIDQAQRPRGVLDLAELLQRDPKLLVADAMHELPVFFYTDEPMRDVVSAFEKYDLVSAPVVNLHDQIVGRITVDVVLDEINARAQSEGLRQVGLSREDEDQRSPALPAAKRRWPWIAANLCTAFLASRVISRFGDVISALVVVAALMPIVASLGGNAGQQSVALVTQRLTLGQLTWLEFARTLRRELTIGIINGVVWGSVLGVLTLALYTDVALGAVIGLAVLLNLILAAAVGVTVPVLLQRAGRDPVMGSTVILTAATDFMGYLIFLGLAAAFLI